MSRLYGHSAAAEETSGEANGIAFIIGEYGDMLYKLAVAQLNNKSDAYDAVQDVMLKIHVSKPKWKNSAHLKAWLIRAVINKCRDYNRSYWNRNSVELSEVYGVSRNAPDYELQNTLANMPPKYRETLYLHYYMGYKISEIAKILRLTESGVKNRLTRGRKLLKTALD